MTEEATTARVEGIELAEPEDSWGAAYDQRGMFWLTCHGIPVLNLSNVFARAASPSPQEQEQPRVDPAMLTEFDAWLSFRPEFAEVLTAFRKAFGTDTSARAALDPNGEHHE